MSQKTTPSAKLCELLFARHTALRCMSLGQEVALLSLPCARAAGAGLGSVPASAMALLTNSQQVPFLLCASVSPPVLCPLSLGAPLGRDCICTSASEAHLAMTDIQCFYHAMCALVHPLGLCATLIVPCQLHTSWQETSTVGQAPVTLWPIITGPHAAWNGIGI